MLADEWGNSHTEDYLKELCLPIQLNILLLGQKAPPDSSYF